MNDVLTSSPIPRNNSSLHSFNLSITLCFATSFSRKREPLQLQALLQTDSSPRRNPALPNQEEF